MGELNHEMVLWSVAGCAGLVLVTLLTLLGLYLFVPALRHRWLPLPRLRPGNWTGHDVFLVFCVLFGLPSLIVEVLSRIGFFRGLIGIAPDSSPEDLAFNLYLGKCGLIAGPLILPLVLVAFFGILYARSNSRPHQYGLSWARWPTNLALGLVTFIAATPIILGGNVLVSLALDHRPNQLEIIVQQKLEGWEWGLLAFRALVMAPLLEEIAFRGILQGWLRRASLLGHVILLGLTLNFGASQVSYFDPKAGDTVYDFGPFIFAALLAGGYGFWMFRLMKVYHLAEDEVRNWLPQQDKPSGEADPGPRELAQPFDERRLHNWRRANAFLAIYGSAMLFAMNHSSWPDPIALFPLGLILGWLALRTQSLIGPIIFHSMFNAIAFILLYTSVLFGPETNGNEQTATDRPPVAVSVMSSVPGSQLPLRK